MLCGCQIDGDSMGGGGGEEWFPAQPAAEDLRNTPPRIDTVGGHVFLNR